MMAENDAEKDGEREVYRTAIRGLEDLPPSANDPIAQPVARFGQLSPRVRLLLQLFSNRDVDTLVKVIRLHQRSETTFRVGRKLIFWFFGAVAATLLAGDQSIRIFNQMQSWLW
jgi:hypothetical protein